MTNRILLKRSSVANSVPSAGMLEYGELALNYSDGNLFFKDAGNVVTTLASTQFVNVSGNVTGNNFIGNGDSLSNIDAFGTIVVSGQGNVVAEIPSDSITLAEGPGITITTDAGNKTVTFQSTLTTSIVSSAVFGVGGGMGGVANAAVSDADIGLVTSPTAEYQDLGLITEAAAVQYEIETAGNVTAQYFFGNVACASGIFTTKIFNGNSEANVVDPNGNLVISINGTANVMVVDSTGANIIGTLKTTGNANVGNLGTVGDVSAGYFVGNGSQLTGVIASAVDASNVTGTTLAASVVNSSLTNVGTLSGLTVIGESNYTGNINITGNLAVTGNLNYENVVDLVVGDPLIFIGANNTANLLDLGEVTQWNDGTLQYGGIVRDASDGVWKVFGNVITKPTTTVDFTNAVYQPFRSGSATFSGANVNGELTGATSGAFSGNVTTGNVSGTTGTFTNVGGTLTTNAQPNITSVGSLTSLDVIGNITSGNLQGTSISGTLITAAQTNITSVGNLSSLSVIGNADAGNINSTNGVFAGNLSVTGDAAHAGNLDVTGTINALGEITSTGNIQSSGNVTAAYINGNGGALTGINAFGIIAVASQDSVYAENISDTLTLVAGTGIGISTEASTDTITLISYSDIWSVGGGMGLVTEVVDIRYDFGSVTDAATVSYDLGGLVVSGVVTNSSIIPNVITGDKFASDIEISTTGNITANGLILTGNTATITSANYQIGFLTVPQIGLTANIVAGLSDSGKHYYSTTAGNLALTLPSNANVAYPVGTELKIVVQAAGNVIIDLQAGVSLYLAGNSTSASRTVQSYGVASLLKVADNSWFVSGAGVV